MNKGDIVLVPFPFTDLSGIKTRPALVLIKSTNDVTVCFITSRLTSREEFDVIIGPSFENGIKKKSAIRLRKIVTLDANLILGRIGKLSAAEISEINQNLKELLSLQ